jgi:hypothetical protein
MNWDFFYKNYNNLKKVLYTQISKKIQKYDEDFKRRNWNIKKVLN